MKSMGWTDKTLFQALDPERIDQPATCIRADNQTHAHDTRPMDSYSRADIDEMRPVPWPANCCTTCFCDCAVRKASLCAVDGKNVRSVAHRCEYPNRCAKGCKYKKPRTCLISGGIELVPLLARRRAMQRPISLSTTDVTKCSAEKKLL